MEIEEYMRFYRKEGEVETLSPSDSYYYIWKKHGRPGTVGRVVLWADLQGQSRIYSGEKSKTRRGEKSQNAAAADAGTARILPGKRWRKVFWKSAPNGVSCLWIWLRKRGISMRMN